MATLQELDQALLLAVEENNTAVINELSTLIEQAEAQQGYQPTDYNLIEEAGKGFSRIGQRISSLPEFAFKQLAKTAALDKPLGMAALPIAGEAAQAGLITPISEALTIGGKTALELTDDDFEKEIADQAVETFESLMGNPTAAKITELGIEAAKAGQNAWMEFKNRYPIESDNIVGALQIAELYKPPAFRKPVPQSSSDLKRRGVALQRQAAEKTLEGKRQQMQQVLELEDTKANRLKTVKNKRSDPRTGTTYYVPTERDIELYDLLINKTEVSHKNSNQRNLDIVNDTIKKRGKQLTSELREYDYVKFNLSDIRSDMRAVLKGMLDPDSPDFNPALNNNTRVKAATDLFSWLDTKLKGKKITPSRLYGLRKELDDHINRLKGDVFDGTQTALSEAERAVRNYLNKKVIEGAGFSDVAKDLREMHLLYDARNILEPKAADDLNTSMGRSIQNIARITDTVMPKTLGGKVNNIRMVTGAGAVTAIGTLTPYLPYVAAGAGLGYLAYRGVNSNATRKQLGKTLVAIDKAMKQTKLKEMKEALALDRATIIEAMKLPLANIDDPEEENAEEEVNVPYRR
jgi:hypothetical protein